MYPENLFVFRHPRWALPCCLGGLRLERRSQKCVTWRTRVRRSALCWATSVGLWFFLHEGSAMERDETANSLHAMASALSGRVPDWAAMATAEARARAELTAKIAALPPSAVFSKAALKGFRQQHAEMAAYAEAATAPPPPMAAQPQPTPPQPMVAPPQPMAAPPQPMAALPTMSPASAKI